MWLTRFLKKEDKDLKKNSIDFGDKDYKMKDEYDANNIFIGHFEKISSEISLDDDFAPSIEITKQKYFFEPVIENEQIKYRELFTGFITEDLSDSKDFDYFDFPYICDIEKFTDYFPNTENKKIPKLSLIWALNDVNCKRKDKQLQK